MHLDRYHTSLCLMSYNISEFHQASSAIYKTAIASSQHIFVQTCGAPPSSPSRKGFSKGTLYLLSFSSLCSRCSSDTLPMLTNLCHWKIQMSCQCKLCDAPQATAPHILFGCKQALENGRYSWRHDSVLLKIVSGLRDLLPASNSIFADLTNLRAHASPPATVPPQVLFTSARPDIVICNNNVVRIIELTVCSNNTSTMLEAKRRKENKELYNSLFNDLRHQG